MAGHEFEVIVGLATALQGGTGWFIRFLIGLLAQRDATIKEMIATQAASSVTNQKLAEQVPGLTAENERLRRRTEA